MQKVGDTVEEVKESMPVTTLVRSSLALVIMRRFCAGSEERIFLCKNS